MESVIINTVLNCSLPGEVKGLKWDNPRSRREYQIVRTIWGEPNCADKSQNGVAVWKNLSDMVSTIRIDDDGPTTVTFIDFNLSDDTLNSWEEQNGTSVQGIDYFSVILNVTVAKLRENKSMSDFDLQHFFTRAKTKLEQDITEGNFELAENILNYIFEDEIIEEIVSEKKNSDGETVQPPENNNVKVSRTRVKKVRSINRNDNKVNKNNRRRNKSSEKKSNLKERKDTPGSPFFPIQDDNAVLSPGPQNFFQIETIRK